MLPIKRYELDLEGGKPTMEESDEGPWFPVADILPLLREARAIAKSFVASWDGEINPMTLEKAESFLTTTAAIEEEKE